MYFFYIGLFFINSILVTDVYFIVILFPVVLDAW